MQVRIEILKEGDSVFAVWESHVAVKKATGEVEIFQYGLDEEGLPRLSAGTVLITHGEGSISAKSGNPEDDDFIEVTTF